MKSPYSSYKNNLTYSSFVTEITFMISVRCYKYLIKLFMLKYDFLAITNCVLDNFTHSFGINSHNVSLAITNDTIIS